MGMPKKVLIIVSSGEENKEKAMIGMRLAIGLKKNKISEEVGMLFFGPSERLVAGDDSDINNLLKEAADNGINPFACSGIANRDDISVKLASKNISLEGASKTIGRYLESGFVPIPF